MLQYMRVLEPFFNRYNSEYSALRGKIRDILQQEDSLTEIVQLVGRESLSEDQKVRLQMSNRVQESESSTHAFTVCIWEAAIYVCL